MNNTMRVIAKAGGYEVVQELSGCVSIHNGRGVHICDKGSAYELIAAVPEKEIRAELLKQWEADLARQEYAERRSEGDENGSSL